MKSRLLLMVLALATGVAMAADPPAGASGTFKSHGVTMKVASAMAFRGTSLFDKAEVLVVALSSSPVNTGMLADYYDRRRAYDKRIKDAETGVVFLEFALDGKYRALSYYFASGNGCAYCSGGVASTVKLAGGRLAGTLKANEADRAFDVTLDVAVTPDDHGAALPADGGAPGKAYLAFHDALARRDTKALRPLLAPESAHQLDRATKDGKATAYLEFLAEDHPLKSVQVTKGWSTDNKAILLVAGETNVLKLTGEVLLVKEAGTWRVLDEVTEIVVP